MSEPVARAGLASPPTNPPPPLPTAVAGDDAHGTPHRGESCIPNGLTAGGGGTRAVTRIKPRPTPFRKVVTIRT